MSPDMAMESMLPDTNSLLFNIPKLTNDGSNWITYKERMLTALGAQGLMWYVDGCVVEPVPFVINPATSSVMKPDGSTPT
jgi:hypothetical protein